MPRFGNLLLRYGIPEIIPDWTRPLIKRGREEGLIERGGMLTSADLNLLCEAYPEMIPPFLTHRAGPVWWEGAHDKQASLWARVYDVYQPRHKSWMSEPPPSPEEMVVHTAELSGENRSYSRSANQHFWLRIDQPNRGFGGGYRLWSDLCHFITHVNNVPVERPLCDCPLDVHPVPRLNSHADPHFSWAGGCRCLCPLCHHEQVGCICPDCTTHVPEDESGNSIGHWRLPTSEELHGRQ